MRKTHFYLLIFTLTVMFACTKKESKKDIAINLIKAEYGNVRLNFYRANLDTLYNITPAAYADSVEKGKNLDEHLAALESQIEHLPQRASDSVGRISAELTKQRYRLLDIEKTKPKFIGWKLSQVMVQGKEVKALDFNFDKELTKIVK